MFPSRKYLLVCFINSRSSKSWRKADVIPSSGLSCVHQRASTAILWQFAHVDHAIFDHLSLDMVVGECVCSVPVGSCCLETDVHFLFAVATMNVLVSDATH